MSSWRSNSPNKNFDSKSTFPTNVTTIKTDYSTYLSVLKQNNIKSSRSQSIIVDNSHMTLHNNLTLPFLKDQQQASTRRDTNNLVTQQLPKFFRFGTSVTSVKKTEEQNMSNYKTLDQNIDWEQIPQ